MSEEPELTPVPQPKYPPKPAPEPGTARDVVSTTMEGVVLGDLPGAGVGLIVGLWRRLGRWRKRTG